MFRGVIGSLNIRVSISVSISNENLTSSGLDVSGMNTSGMSVVGRIELPAISIMKLEGSDTRHKGPAVHS